MIEQKKEDLIEKIHLGDCVEFMKSLEGKLFDVSFTSPPYNRIRNDTYAKFDDISSDYYKLLCDVTENLLRLTKENVIINVQSNLFNKIDVAKWQGKFAEYLKGCVIWTKENPCPSWNYKTDKEVYSVTNAFEYFFVFGEDSQEFEANNKIFNYIHTNVNSKRFEGHGAVMKLEVAEFFIKNFSKKNDFVFDPFMGMGTTAVACVHNNRLWGGTEIVPDYREQALRRISNEKSQTPLFLYEDIENYEQQTLFE